jgi:NAD(P) transhydrogenase subunit alpha
MKIAVPKEFLHDECRVALVPESCKKLLKAGFEVEVESGAGEAATFPDEAFTEAGARIVSDVRALFGEADLVVKVHPPDLRPSLGVHEADLMKEGSMLLATILPARNLLGVELLAAHKITSFAIDCLPRITRAQTMDVLSSMSSIAGYKSVLIAANELPKYFPMFMTAAGTVLPAKVFVIGAGVAGLQAIATARRLGAVVEATDTRSAVKQEIESLGARFVGVETEQEAQDARGYARDLSPEFYKKQAELIAARCAASDVVITTALIGGIKAPRLISADMVARMKPGSVIVDLAADGGGNCELSEPGKTIVAHGVKICAPTNLPSLTPAHASILYSRNLTAFILAFWKDGAIRLDFTDEILKESTITHGGAVVHEPTSKLLNLQGATR